MKCTVGVVRKYKRFFEQTKTKVLAKILTVEA